MIARCDNIMTMSDYVLWLYGKNIVIDIKIIRLFYVNLFCSPWSVIRLGLVWYLKMAGKPRRRRTERIRKLI